MFSDPAGRYVAVVLDIGYRKLLLVNVYLPPPFIQLLYDLFVKLASFVHLPLILMGDFNALLDTLDSSNPGRMRSVDLSCASVTRFTELWR